MVGGHTGLTRIQPLAPHQPAGRGGQGRIGKHDGRTLPPQLQGDGREVRGGGGHDQPGHPGSAREEDVVEAVLQQLGGHLATALHHLHGAGREGLLEQARDQVGGMGGQLRGFHHRRVARRQGAHQGLEAELERIVPGPHNQHAPEGLGPHLGTGGPTPERQPDGLSGQPAFEVASGVAQLLLHPGPFHIGLQRGLAQILGQGFQQGRFRSRQQALKTVELVEPPGKRPGGALQHGLAHGLHRWREQGLGNGHGGQGQLCWATISRSALSSGSLGPSWANRRAVARERSPLASRPSMAGSQAWGRPWRD